MGVALEGETRERWVLMTRRQRIIARNRSRRVLVKRRRPKRAEASRRSSKAIERRVKTLKELIPNTSTRRESTSLDGLFRETADYILALQMKVRVMQDMVQVLSQPKLV
ncbi:PREDICTED: transcription factor UPBEAT1 [Tarenaya hassleriana]|uniref:transcription factor UPBEAT1 n=1 Tax=Tarenaya hassleriana TaxID=28532 RepID=UPI00053C10E6|nr:PREDICTED: transcription factor UPBEAT1 [Tarenaya hassleriana]